MPERARDSDRTCETRMVTRQHETTVVAEFVGRRCEEFLAVPEAGTPELLYLRLENSWYRAFLDEGVLFLDESEVPGPEHDDGMYVDLAETLGVRRARLREFSAHDGVLRVTFDAGTPLVLTEQGRVAPQLP